MFLKNIWYYALPADRLKPGAMVRKVMLSQPILIGRTKTGAVFAMRDICPHRGVPLSAGAIYGPGESVDTVAIDSDQIECPYHGWRFKPDGRCAAIPALTSDHDVDLAKIRVRSYPVRERQGLIWIYMSDQPIDGPLLEDEAPAFEPPEIPAVGERIPGMRLNMTFECHVDQAVLGLIDPAHGPFVHRAWWWRTGSSMHDKTKRFGPTARGFAMLQHKPSKNSFFYRVLGSDLTTEIEFQLPGLRTELIRLGKGAVCGVTTVTPIDENNTDVTQQFFWTEPWLRMLTPVVKGLGYGFLKQDKDIIEIQKDGLKYDPRLMLISDPDAQARWYFRLKKAWADAVEEGTPFKNPLDGEVTLRWRS